MTETVGDRRTSDYWRERAEEARTKADQMRDATAKTIMLEIAQKYEAMAERAARREAS
jgi:hypothetical protein